MNNQPTFQGPFWRRYSNASVSGLIGENTGQNVQLSGLPVYTVRLESSDLAMGTVNYRVLSVPASTDQGRTPGTAQDNHSVDMFSTVATPTFKKGTRVRIIASAGSNYVWDRFVDGNGNVIPSQTAMIDITVNQSMTIRAIFRARNEQQYATLNVSYNHAQGTVTATPALTNDSVTVPFGSSVVLTATPKSGYVFKQWRNALNGGGTNHTVITEPVHSERMIVGDKTIYADFEKVAATPGTPGAGSKKTVTVRWTEGKGRVTANTTLASSLKNAFTVNVNEGDTITIKATPKTGYRFAKWTGGPVNGTTEAQVTFAVNGDYTINANFTADNGGGGGGENPTDPNPGGGGGGGTTPVDTMPDTTGTVMAFVKKWWWALLIAAYLIYDATKGGRK